MNQQETEHQPERPSSGFSLTAEEKADILRRTQLARSSERVKAREADTKYIRWLSVPRSAAELAKYPDPTTIEELRKIQGAFRDPEDHQAQ